MRRFIRFSLIAMITVANGVTALANPILPSEDFFIEQNIDKQMVVEQLENQEDYIVENSKDQEKIEETEETEETEDKEETEDNDINDFRFARLNKGFNDVEISTFEKFKALTFEGDEGVEIWVVVYHEEDEVVVTNYYNQVIGGGHSYSEKIGLDYIGKNYVMIMSGLEGQFYAKQFIINRKDITIKEKLENKLVNPTKDINVEVNDKIKEIKEEIRESMTSGSAGIQDMGETIKPNNGFNMVR